MCGVATTPASARSGCPVGSGSVSKTSSPAPPMRRDRSASTRADSSTIGPREVLTSRRRWLHQRQFVSTDQATGSFTEHQMDRQDVGGGEQLVLRHIGRAGLFGGLRGQVGAPRDDVHAERLADLRHPAADAAQPQDPSTVPPSWRPTEVCQPPPRTDTDSSTIRRAVRQNQRPGELDRRLHVAAGGADVDAAFLGGRDVDGGVERPRRGDHLEPRQALDDVPWQWRALTHHAYHVERLESLDDRIRIGDVIVEHGDRGAGGHLRPVSHGQRDVLVIIENRDLHRPNFAHQV